MKKTQLLEQLHAILAQMEQGDMKGAQADLALLIQTVEEVREESTVTPINRKIHHVDGGW